MTEGVGKPEPRLLAEAVRRKRSLIDLDRSVKNLNSQWGGSADPHPPIADPCRDRPLVTPIPWRI